MPVDGGVEIVETAMGRVLFDAQRMRLRAGYAAPFELAPTLAGAQLFVGLADGSMAIIGPGHGLRARAEHGPCVIVYRMADDGLVGSIERVGIVVIGCDHDDVQQEAAHILGARIFN
ncbi:MAG: hypothetical protein HKL99_10850 [Burkholderiales bacterium]|nr:hypothetical protein [Burkholderiales bacterium]